MSYHDDNFYSEHSNDSLSIFKRSERDFKIANWSQTSYLEFDVGTKVLNNNQLDGKEPGPENYFSTD